MRGNRLLGLIGLVLLMESCSYTTSISIETLEPPTNLYLDIRKPITVSYTFVPSNEMHDIIGNKNDIDSIAADAAAYVMAYSMKQNALLLQTNVITTQIQRNDSLASNDYSLTDKELTKITFKTKGDIVLSLDYFSLNPEVLVFPSYDGGYSAFLNMNAVAIWRVYSPKNKKIIGEYLFKNEYKWNSVGESKVLALNNLPKMNEVALWIGAECGDNSVRAFIPFWANVSRNIYVNPIASWIRAENYVKMGDWNSAVKIWSWQVGDNKNTKKQWQAAYNLAVACEVQNNLLLALNWLDVADTFVSGTLEVKAYRETLQLRLKSQKILESIKEKPCLF